MSWGCLLVCPLPPSASEDTETTTAHPLFPKRMKKHFGFCFFVFSGSWNFMADRQWQGRGVVSRGQGGDFSFSEDGTQMWTHIRKLQLLECLPSPSFPLSPYLPFSLAAGKNH